MLQQPALPLDSFAFRGLANAKLQEYLMCVERHDAPGFSLPFAYPCLILALHVASDMFPQLGAGP
jgi:hypothetical protein